MPYGTIRALPNETLKLDPKVYEQVTKELLPAATADFHAPARSPFFSAMDCANFKSAFGLQLPD